MRRTGHKGAGRVTRVQDGSQGCRTGHKGAGWVTMSAGRVTRVQDGSQSALRRSLYPQDGSPGAQDGSQSALVGSPRALVVSPGALRRSLFPLVGYQKALQ